MENIIPKTKGTLKNISNNINNSIKSPTIKSPTINSPTIKNILNSNALDNIENKIDNVEYNINNTSSNISNFFKNNIFSIFFWVGLLILIIFLGINAEDFYKKLINLINTIQNDINDYFSTKKK